MKKTNYYDFWNSNRVLDIKDDSDLIYQVGWSKCNKPLSTQIIYIMVGIINNKLDLNPEDIILDFCCGNGIISFELSKYVAHLIGIDFSKIYIENANVFKKKSNTEYFLGSVHDFDTLIDKEILAKFGDSCVKILMSYSLGYFDTKNFSLLLSKLNSHFGKFKFYITGIPDFKKYKIVFPNIISKVKFIILDRILKQTKGIGRFWIKNEIKFIAQKFSLTCTFDNDFDAISGQEYRFNLLLEKK